MALAFVHEASLRLDDGADDRAPGAAVTFELCGDWEHEGPCRWPHLSSIGTRSGDALSLRVAFVAEPSDETEVRLRIARALARGRLEGAPQPSGWTLVSEAPGELGPTDVAFASRHGGP